MDPFYENRSRAAACSRRHIDQRRLEIAGRQDFRTPDTWHVEAHGPDGKLLGTLMTLPGRTFGRGSSGILEGPWFEASSSIDVKGHTVAIANGRDPEVRVLDHELRLRLIIRWDAPGREVTVAHIRSAREAARRQVREAGAVSPLERAYLNRTGRRGRLSRCQLGQGGRGWDRVGVALPPAGRGARTVTSDGLRLRWGFRVLPVPHQEQLHDLRVRGGLRARGAGGRARSAARGDVRLVAAGRITTVVPEMTGPAVAHPAAEGHPGGRPALTVS